MDIVELPSMFRLAKEISKLSECKTRVGAVICDKRHPISIGYNKAKTHPKWNSPVKKTIHAEMSAIVASGRDRLDGATIFVYRETRNGDIAMARPCEDCLSVLQVYGVRTLVYTVGEYPFFKVEKI